MRFRIEPFTGDGETKVFNLTYGPFSEDSLHVFVRGVLQTRDVHYTEAVDKESITFVTAPPDEWVIETWYYSELAAWEIATEGTTFKQMMQRDAMRSFLNTNEFAETIDYTAKGADAKEINAMVIRQRLDSTNQGSGRIAAGQAEIYIANDATYGVSSISKGFDKVSFAEVLGGLDIDWIVVDILQMDEAMWHLLVQK